jgi:Aspartyl/Asparaginyl beta-hydroxylase
MLATKCEQFGLGVDPKGLANWIAAIPLEEWPQQQPALSWHHFAIQAAYLRFNLAEDIFPEYNLRDPMLSLVIPGDDTQAHIVQLGSQWDGRIHVPLITNTAAKFIIEDEVFHLKYGYGYIVDISRTHSAENNGGIPTIHFIIDRYKP